MIPSDEQVQELLFLPKNLLFTDQYDAFAYGIILLIEDIDSSQLKQHHIGLAKVFSLIFLTKNYELLASLQKIFQIGLKHLHAQLNTQMTFSHTQKTDYLKNCLSLLPYLEYSNKQVIHIPVWEVEQWHLRPFRIDTIELTHNQLLLNPYDRTYAYGLYHDSQLAYLIFSGTTYPAGNGFHTHIQNDLEAQTTPGTSLYYRSKHLILSWLEHNQIQKLNILGISLGGSLSIIAGLDLEHIDCEVFAFNPPGLYKLPSHQPKPEHHFKIYIQSNDFIASFGVFHPNFEVFHIKPKHKNILIDHFANHLGKSSSQISKIDNIEAENQSRHIKNYWIYGVLRSFIYNCFFLPYHYLLRPLSYQTYSLGLSAILMIFNVFQNPFYAFALGLCLQNTIDMQNHLPIFITSIGLGASFILSSAIPMYMLFCILFSMQIAYILDDKAKHQYDERMSHV